MGSTSLPPAGAGINPYVEAFEQARIAAPNCDFSRFLPGRDHPLYLQVLAEFIRIDLEHAWTAGRRPPLETYQARFPEAFAEPGARAAVAFEEFRMRRQAGDRPDPAEYERRFGLNLSDWLKALEHAHQPVRAETSAPANPIL